MPRRLTPLLVLFATSVANGAPLIADNAASAAHGAADAQANTLTRPHGEPGTIELLIEMQPRSAGLVFNERARSRDKPVPSAAVGPERDSTTHPSRPANDRGGLFGAGAVPAVSRGNSSSETDYRSIGTGRSVTDRADRSAADGQRRAALLPAEIIELVRDNREWVIAGAVALLSLLWVGSVALGRASR